MNNDNALSQFNTHDFEDNLKVLHKKYGRDELINIIASIALKHEPIYMKGKDHKEHRTPATGIRSSYYQALMRVAVDSKFPKARMHAERLYTSKSANSYYLIFNKYVYEDVMNHMYLMRKSLSF